ncbi:hypothetical protein HMPREF0454_04290 [Hafnia alvei ATCC 51873]|uniref:Uncharacterized protein n=1 Tax=Hafnia alvei ATCC 51873 TaxID=1002364 RepID=G9YCF1_HAFAL|nr:hypothetical protein HMPREF0454_04290 [Hafnia alvei ATCC 51873]
MEQWVISGRPQTPRFPNEGLNNSQTIPFLLLLDYGAVKAEIKYMLSH